MQIWEDMSSVLQNVTQEIFFSCRGIKYFSHFVHAKSENIAMWLSSKMIQ